MRTRGQAGPQLFTSIQFHQVTLSEERFITFKGCQVNPFQERVLKRELSFLIYHFRLIGHNSKGTARVYALKIDQELKDSDSSPLPSAHSAAGLAGRSPRPPTGVDSFALCAQPGPALPHRRSWQEDTHCCCRVETY